MSPRKPVLFDLGDDAPTPDPATAPPPPDDSAPPPQGRAMLTGAALVTRPRGRLGRWVASALGLLAALALSVAAWDLADRLLERAPVLGVVAVALMTVVALGVLVLAGREWLGFRRLRRIDALRTRATAATDATEARAAASEIAALYTDRPELRWPRERLRERLPDSFDADGTRMLTETIVLSPIDTAARAEVEATARQVALITAVVPMAALDVAVALASNLRMMRRIATLYGGRTGTLGSLRLLRAVFTHLLATGLVSAGDDLLGSAAGGGLMSKLSRRFGEGVMNAALTARVGVAAIEVCRPLPFEHAARPRVTAVVQRALTGLFDRRTPPAPDGGG